MGCGGGREEKQVASEQKWDYFNLEDFKSSSCFAPFSYFILWIALFISIACYVIDVWTAYNLLAFGRWGKIEPAIPISISRWIFTGCIILSWVLLAYRWMTAIRAIKSDGVARSYLDPLAVRVQSIRLGSGQGWRRFLVFAELTKSKKGSEYVAVFSYFSFEAWMRILFAEGPRNVINALTLYSVMNTKLLPTDKNPADVGHPAVTQFFINLKILASDDHAKAAILFGMLFTLVIWVVAFLSLCIACILYVMFLWHHIPRQDGTLRKYLKRKVDKRLQRIVDIKVKKALTKDSLPKTMDELRAGAGPADIKRQPTLPLLEDDKMPDMPTLHRQDTRGTLPPYTSRPPTRGESPIPGFDRPDLSADFPRPGTAGRSDTLRSNTSFRSNAPLMSSAASMGQDASNYDNRTIPLSRMGSDLASMDGRSIMSGASSNASRPPRPFTPQGPPRSFTPTGEPPRGFTPGPPNRQNTGFSDSSGRRTPGPTRSNTGLSDFSTGRASPFTAPPRSNTAMSNMSDRRSPSNGPFPRPPPAVSHGRVSPAFSSSASDFGGNESYELRQQPAAPRFQPYHPLGAGVSSREPSPVLMRNFTSPLRPYEGAGGPGRMTPPQRCGTAPIPRNAGFNETSYGSYGGGPYR